MMQKIILKIALISLFFLPTTLFAWQWMDLWQTPDQQATKLLQAGKAEQASQVFKNKNWQGVAAYRAGNYTQALQRFNQQKTSDGQYNAGNAAAYLGHYQDAINAYDKAIALNPNNTDAITNREIIKKLLNKKNQQNKTPNSKNSSASKNTKKNAENNQQKDGNKDDKKDENKDAGSEQQANNSSQTKGKNKDPMQGDQKSEAKQENAQGETSSRSQAQEDKKQLLRRLADDPGGLLRQKFIRDYYRRHSVDENLNQEVN